jgi:integrase
VASLWHHPKSPNWAACFTVHVPHSLAQRWKRSVKTKDRKVAQSIADALEEAGRGALTEDAIASFTEKIRDVKARTTAIEIFRDVFRTVNGREFGAGSLRAFAESWLAGMRVELAAQSWASYKNAIEVFLTFLGPVADRELLGFGLRDDVLVIQFRDSLAARLAPSSVNRSLKIIRAMFKSASQRFKIESPARLVGGVKSKGQENARRAFTLPELGRILRVARGSEWQGIILAGLYLGQRLGDIATLRLRTTMIAARRRLISQKNKPMAHRPFIGTMQSR